MQPASSRPRRPQVAVKRLGRGLTTVVLLGARRAPARKSPPRRPSRDTRFMSVRIVVSADAPSV
jgi:hypothetical protein